MTTRKVIPARDGHRKVTVIAHDHALRDTALQSEAMQAGERTGADLRTPMDAEQPRLCNTAVVRA